MRQAQNASPQENELTSAYTIPQNSNRDGTSDLAESNDIREGKISEALNKIQLNSSSVDDLKNSLETSIKRTNEADNPQHKEKIESTRDDSRSYARNASSSINHEPINLQDSREIAIPNTNLLSQSSTTSDNNTSQSAEPAGKGGNTGFTQEIAAKVAPSTSVVNDQKRVSSPQQSLLPTLDPQMLSLSTVSDVTIPAVDLEIDAPDKSSQPYLRIGGSARLNYIITPESQDTRVGKYDHSSYSWTLGADYGRSYGDWAWEVGLSYHSLRYDSRNLSRLLVTAPVEEFTTVQARNFSYSILSLPVSLRYDYRRSAQSTAYIKAGATMHYLMSTKYDLTAYEVAILLSEPVVREVDIVGPPPQSLERSGFKDNSYTTFTLGIGIDRRLGNGMMWYLEPKIDLHLGKGIGPSWDRVHGFSFSTGLTFGL